MWGEDSSIRRGIDHAWFVDESYMTHAWIMNEDGSNEYRIKSSAFKVQTFFTQFKSSSNCQSTWHKL